MIGIQTYKTEINKIGEAFCDFCRIWNIEEHDKYGELYFNLREKLGIKSPISTEAKMLKIGVIDCDCLQVLVNMIQKFTESSISINWGRIIVRQGEAYAKINIFKNPDYDEVRRFGYTISDYTGTQEYRENSMFLYISTLVSGAQDDGKKLIKEIQRWCNIPILLEAGYLFNIDENESPEYLDKLEEYYENLGFKNINDRVGCYDTKTAMLWVPTKSALDSFAREAKEN